MNSFRNILISFLFLFTLSTKLCAQDTLFFIDERSDVIIKVSQEHYKDRLKLQTEEWECYLSFLNEITESTGREKPVPRLYFTSSPCYSRDFFLKHEKILYELIRDNKITLIKDGIAYSLEEIRIKKSKVICCEGEESSFRCGKEWNILNRTKDEELISLTKRINLRGRRLFNCF